MNPTQLLLRTLCLSLGGLVCIASGYWLGISGHKAADDNHQASHSTSVVHEDSHNGHPQNGHSHSGHGDHAGESPFAHNPFDESAIDDHQHGPDSEYLGITSEAVMNLHLELRPLTKSDYVQETMLPGQLIARPGIGRQYISAPVKGVVIDILVQQGQLIDKNTTLVSLALTDEELVSTQKELLANSSRLSVIDLELARLEPLASTGGVAGRRLRELSYERDQLTAQQSVMIGVAELRGISRAAIDELSLSGKLIRSMDVTMMSLENTSAGSDPSSPASETRQTAIHERVSSPVRRVSEFTIETLDVSLGQTVERGQPVCQVSDYSELLVKTVAFESDIELIRNLQETQQHVAVEFGHDQANDHGYEYRREGLNVGYVDQRIDQETQSLHMYVPISNERTKLPQENENLRFAAWRFRPGQRVHVKVPIKTWKNVITVPLNAIVEEGAETFVFRQHTHQGHDDEHQLEFETVPVRVLHKDQRFAILAENNLATSDRIVMNRAYQLHLAMKVRTTGGAHGHGHDH